MASQAMSPNRGMAKEDMEMLKKFKEQSEKPWAPTTSLVVKAVVNHEANDVQESRAEELKELVTLGQEEFFDIFEMLPRTEMDVYDQKLLAGTHKLALIQTGSEDVEQET